MYYFKEFVSKYNLKKQLSDCEFYVTDNRLVIDGPDFRLSVYGWPDNRVVTANKVTGVNRIMRFGYNGTQRCTAYVKQCLETLGVDTLEDDWNTEKIHQILRDSLCEECRKEI